MLRLLIKEFTVNKLIEQRQLSVHLRWQGGACTDLFVSDSTKRSQGVIVIVLRLSIAFVTWRAVCSTHRSLTDSIEKAARVRKASRILRNDSVDPLALSDSACKAQEA